MNPEDILRQAQQRSYLTRNPTERELDEFIDRCMKEKGEALMTLAQALQWTLQQASVMTYPQTEIYPQVLQRIQARLQKGET